jgi:hypothetical protein
MRARRHRTERGQRDASNLVNHCNNIGLQAELAAFFHQPQLQHFGLDGGMFGIVRGREVRSCLM